MIKQKFESTLEIWSAGYIMKDPELREDEDTKVMIIQIEHAHGDDYLVEVLRPERRPVRGAGHGDN